MPAKAPLLNVPTVAAGPQTDGRLFTVSPDSMRGAEMFGCDLAVRREDGATLVTSGHPTTSYHLAHGRGEQLWNEEFDAEDRSAPWQ